MSDQNPSLTPLSKLGPYQITEYIGKSFPLTNKRAVSGIGEDAALIDINSEYFQVCTTVLLNEGVNFDLTYHPLKHLGYKTVVLTFANILAMNGIPEQLMINLAVNSRFSVEAIDEFFKGIKLACTVYETDLIDVNISSSAGAISISGTGIGRTKKEKITKRTGAKPNDIIVVTGDLGAAYIGLQVLEKEKAVFKMNPDMQPELENYNYLIERQLKPELPLSLLKELMQLSCQPTSMILISHGLAGAILSLTKASNVGARIFDEKLPIHPLTQETSLKFNIDPTTCACNGGEDYELLFTIDQKDVEKLQSKTDLSFIGYITDQKYNNEIITKSGNSSPITTPGWPPVENTKTHPN